ncbi:hypothetical protein [Wenxinia marina]|uniref:hypothetical protein n=1 Tax=Wenxinia marina TaxID=390641 RepID=UPI0012DFF982|nr:hypothetical protein [Wenxinia marina]GGL79971.1 hypothetical protein GCM10011392_38130 [Wenxinia marina]
MWWVIGGIALIIVLLIGAAQQAREEAIKAHMDNLLKGGLIPRVSKDVHNEALKRIGKARPNVRLPRRQYFNDD